MGVVPALITQNDLPDEPETRVVPSFSEPSGTQTHILEVGPKTRDLLADRRRVYIGWTACPVYENLGVRRCTKYCPFGHTAKVCSVTKPVCRECSGPHPICKTDWPRCEACSRHNERFRSKLNALHPFASRECTTLREKEHQAQLQLAY